MNENMGSVDENVDIMEKVGFRQIDELLDLLKCYQDGIIKAK